MTTRDVERICFVTGHFNDLQGLRNLVPIGVFFMSLGVTDFFWDPLFAYPVWIMIILGALAWYLPYSRRYYRRTFGEVEQRREGLGVGGSSLPVYSPAGRAPLTAGTRPLNPKVRWLLAAIVNAVAYALLYLLKAILPAATVLTDRSRVDPGWLNPPLAQTLCYLFGVAFLGLWYFKRERHLSQTYHLAIGLLLLGLAVLGTFVSLILPEELRILKIGSLVQLLLPLLADPRWAGILIGAAMVLAGLLDHLQLVRVLKPLREEAA
jgi:hypothetical protein